MAGRVRRERRFGWPDLLIPASLRKKITRDRPPKSGQEPALDGATRIHMVVPVHVTFKNPARSAVVRGQVHNLHGKRAEIPNHKVDIPEIVVPHEPMAGNMPLSKEAVSITVKTIQRAAAANSLAKALEINYQGAGEIACTEAAREEITAFLEKRRPEFKK